MLTVHIDFFKVIVELILIVLLYNFKTMFMLRLLIYIYGYFKLLPTLIIFLIKVYQNVAPDRIRNKCRFEPSCSNYTIETFRKYHLIKAFIKSTNRIYRCSSKNSGGYDYP